MPTSIKNISDFHRVMLSLMFLLPLTKVASADNDPLLGDSQSLEIRDVSAASSPVRRAIRLIKNYSDTLETVIPDERPYFEDEEVIVPEPEFWDGSSWNERSLKTIDIDASGNGTYYNYFFDQHVFGDSTSYTHVGTRTESENSIRWDGSKRTYNSGAGCHSEYVKYRTQTSRTEDGVITQRGDQSHSTTCSGNAGTSFTYAVSGIEKDEYQFCEATAGTMTIESYYPNVTSTVSRASSDAYWNVYVTDTNEGQFVEEYLVPSLDLEFFCQYAGLAAPPLVSSPVVSSPTVSAPTVTGSRISWPDDGWYQVQTSDGIQNVCNGGSVCDVSPGEYLVINHTSGERYNNVAVGGVEQTTVRVDFNITVPMYMSSDELQLELIWGEKIFNASWVGDEYWTASAEFPTETDNLLTVTFYDQNGEIELARYSQQLRTGSNVTEPLVILADQFDTDLFDEDGDGVNNLDELVAGTEPTVDEDFFLTSGLTTG